MEASHTIRRTLAGAGLNARAVSSQGGLVPGGGEPLHDLAGEGAVVALGPAWTHTLLEHVVVGVLLDVRDQVGLVGARPRLAAHAEPGWSKRSEWATLGAACSNVRGSGWPASGPISPPWEQPGAQSRQARPEEARQPRSGTADKARAVLARAVLARAVLARAVHVLAHHSRTARPAELGLSSWWRTRMR